MEIRAVVPADVDAVLAFWKRATHESGLGDGAAAVHRLVERDPGALLLADDGGIVGTLIAGFDGWRCHLYRMAVDPEARRRGVGRALVQAAEERFAGFGMARGDAIVIDDDERATGFWAANGYQRNPDVSRWEHRFG